KMGISPPPTRLTPTITAHVLLIHALRIRVHCRPYGHIAVWQEELKKRDYGRHEPTAIYLENIMISDRYARNIEPISCHQRSFATVSADVEHIRECRLFFCDFPTTFAVDMSGKSVCTCKCDKCTTETCSRSLSRVVRTIEALRDDGNQKWTKLCMRLSKLESDIADVKFTVSSVKPQVRELLVSTDAILKEAARLKHENTELKDEIESVKSEVCELKEYLETININLSLKI
ncbi:hypothetical protein J6590_024970, partial [Homalodisca vitripennis]